MPELFDLQIQQINPTLNSIREKIQTLNSKSTSETAFYHVNLSSIIHQHERWCHLLPRVKPFYAVKCQPDPKIIHLLGSLGAGFDCASRQEIKTVIKTMKWPKEKSASSIIYANPYKFKKDIHFANQAGVQMVTFDSASELDKIHLNYSEARCLLRISPQRQYNVTCVLGNKFGADAADIVPLLEKAKQLGLDIVGISFHVGSGCKEMVAFPETVEYASKVMQMISEAGFSPYLVDIGGGFPGMASNIKCNDDRDEIIKQQQDFEIMCEKLNVILDIYFPESSGYSIIAEPGRYFVMGAYTLATQIIGKRSDDLMTLNRNEFDQTQFDLDGGAFSETSTINSYNMDSASNPSSEEYINPYNDFNMKCHRYIINDGLYGSFNCILYDHAKPFPSGYFDDSNNYLYFSNTNGKSSKAISTIYGPTCDGFDCVLSQVYLPEMNTNQWIVWPNMGAYTGAAANMFNGIELAPYYYFLEEYHLQQFSQFI